jgi:hypothetical protein
MPSLATSLCGVLIRRLDGCSISRSSAPADHEGGGLPPAVSEPVSARLRGIGAFLVSQIMVGAVVAPLFGTFLAGRRRRSRAPELVAPDARRRFHETGLAREQLGHVHSRAVSIGDRDDGIRSRARANERGSAVKTAVGLRGITRLGSDHRERKTGKRPTAPRRAWP